MFVSPVIPGKEVHELLGSIENKKGSEICKWFCESTKWCMHGTMREAVACAGDIKKCESKDKPKKP